MPVPVTHVEIAALLALAQDHAFGQPPGAQLRSTVLAQRLADAVGADPAERATTWWASTLRFLGCTGHAFDMAAIFGDEIELRGVALRADFGDPVEVLRLMLSRAGPGRSGLGRVPALAAVVARGRQIAEVNFRTACEVADAFAVRLGLDKPARAALAAAFERWNGRGLPAGRKGTATPRPMRCAHLCQELEALARAEGIASAIEIVSSRSGKSYDPELADQVVHGATQWWAELEQLDSWDTALELAPDDVPLRPEQITDALLVLADFTDLKSPWFSGHSRGVAKLVGAVCGPDAEAAALLHDLGRVAVPNTIWDKAGPLTRDERDRVQLTPFVTEQLLRRVPYTATLADAASGSHERVDGSGYHRRLLGSQLGDTQRALAAADCYQAMTSDRPYRAAMSAESAARELRSMAAEGRLDTESVERVLVAAGHRRATRVAPRPRGLSAREAEVLQLIALGHTTRQVADRLFISAKTADHHVQHIYTKIGVSTRGAAALFAIEHGLLPAKS